MTKRMEKKQILLISIPLLILLVVIISIIILNKDIILGNQVNSDGNKIKEEYEKLNGKKNEDGKEYPEVKISKKNLLKYITNEEIINIINNKKDAVVYFGSPSCIYCRSAIEVLSNTASETNLDEMLYFDIDKSTASDELINLLGDNLTINESIYPSLVIFIIDGDIVSYNKDTVYSQKDPYIKLNESQIKGLSEIYRYGINDVIKSKNIKENTK